MQKENQQSKEQKEESNDDLPEEKVSYHQLSAPTVHKEHTWIQRGPDIICTSCPSHHGIRVGVHKRLMGFDEKGNIILENV